MNFLIYLIVYPILWLISKLPFSALYLFSDFVYIIVYRIVKYRKRSVRSNLALALPHLTNQERTTIEKKFYRHLCDMFLEMIKTMSISDEEINKRFVYTNLDLYYELENKQKSIALMTAHYASYEWAISLNKKATFKSFAIYKKINNPYFDQLVQKIRAKFEAILITTKNTLTTIVQNKTNNVLGLYGFASDQSPKLSTTYHWANFMNIKVPVHTGAEMLAKKYDLNVMFLKIKKVNRGYYEATFEVLAENTTQIPNYQITDNFLKLVEHQILEAPEFYLWTHNRWKHRV